MEVMYHDYDGQETATRIVKAIQNLEIGVDAVFSTIEERIKLEERGLENLNKRIEIARTKISKISNRGREGKATTVISTAKFPGKDASVKQGLRKTCNDTFISETKKHASKTGEAKQPQEKRCWVRTKKPAGLYSGAESYHLMDLSSSEEVFDSALSGTRYKKVRPNPPRGISATLPKNESIGDSVLFNTKQIPSLDVLDKGSVNSFEMNLDQGTKQQKINNDQDGDMLKLPEAPSSMIHGDILPEIGEYDVSFKPKMKDMVQFNLPSKLDLPDIADISLQSSHEKGSLELSIAPSVRQAEMPELPSMLDFDAPSVFIETSSSSSNVTVSQASNEQKIDLQQQHEQQQKEQSQEGFLVDKPSKNTKNMVLDSSSSSSISELASSQSQIVSQQPSGLLAAITKDPESQESRGKGIHKEPPQAKSHNEQRSQPGSSSVLPSKSGMSGVLAAIRNKDNLVKLKQTAEVKRKDEAEQKNEEERARDKNLDKPLSLAEEMRLKLARRQKILSGQQDEEEQAAEAARKIQLGGSIRAVQAAGKMKRGLEERKRIGDGIFGSMADMVDQVQSKDFIHDSDDGEASEGNSSTDWDF